MVFKAPEPERSPFQTRVSGHSVLSDGSGVTHFRASKSVKRIEMLFINSGSLMMWNDFWGRTLGDDRCAGSSGEFE